MYVNPFMYYNNYYIRFVRESREICTFAFEYIKSLYNLLLLLLCLILLQQITSPYPFSSQPSFPYIPNNRGTRHSQ